MAIQIGTLRVDPPLALAPMVGLSHSALRSLVCQLGGVGLLFTEMLSAKRLPSENPESSPFLTRNKIEKPLFYQFYTTEKYDIEKAVEKLEQLDAQGVDLNLGCPAPHMRKIGAGQFLMGDHAGIEKIIARVREKTVLPISVKIRIGHVAHSKKLLELCKLFEGSGVDLITIHARLFGEKFCRKPQWRILETVIPEIAVPVLVNGGIFSSKDARQCLRESGADGLMIGRGAVCRPWLLRDIAENIYGYDVSGSIPSKESIYFDFISLLEKRFRPERRLGRLKQFTHYYAQNFEFGHGFASKIQNSKSLGDAVEHARMFFERQNKQQESGGK